VADTENQSGECDAQRIKHGHNQRDKQNPFAKGLHRLAEDSTAMQNREGELMGVGMY